MSVYGRICADGVSCAGLFVEGTTLSQWVHASWFIMAAVAAGVIFWWIYDAAYGSFKGWFYEKFKHVVK